MILREQATVISNQLGHFSDTACSYKCYLPNKNTRDQEIQINI